MKKIFIILFASLILFVSNTNAQIKHELGIGTGKFHIEYLGKYYLNTYNFKYNKYQIAYSLPFITTSNLKQELIPTGCIGYYIQTYKQKQCALPTIYYSLYFKKRWALRAALDFEKNTHIYPDYSAYGWGPYGVKNRKFVASILSLSVGVQRNILKIKKANLYTLVDVSLSYGESSYTYTTFTYQDTNLYQEEYNYSGLDLNNINIGCGIKKNICKNFSISAESTLGYSLGFINISPIHRLSFNYMFGR